MQPLAGIETTINQLVIPNILVTELIATAIASGAAWLLHLFSKRDARKLTWRVISDEAVNKGDRDNSGRIVHASQRMWKIVYDYPAPASTLPAPVMDPAGSLGSGGSSTATGTASDPKEEYHVDDPSLVIIELKNNWRNIVTTKNTNEKKLTIDFTGREVVHYKVRDSDAYRKLVDEQAATQPPPGTRSQITLPDPKRFDKGERITLVFLLDRKDGEPAQRTPSVDGELDGRRIVEAGQHRSLFFKIAVVLAALCVIAGLMTAGAALGVSIGNDAGQPAPTCVSGNLTIGGSTAFAPIMTLVATEYMQLCQKVATVEITVTPDASGGGLSGLESGPNPPDIAMFDGTPDPHSQVRGVTGQIIGDIIFAVVGNHSLPDSIFQQGHGLASTDIENAFATGDGHFPEIPGTTVTTVGRYGNSGTLKAFINTVASGSTQAGNAEKEEDSTLDLLAYVNSTKDTIGYAEPDALPFYPNVREIAIDGYLPSAQAVEDGMYKFRAPEHLYTQENPSALTQDFIAFLTSPPVISQLQANTSFLGCSTLAGTKVKEDCQQ